MDRVFTPQVVQGPVCQQPRKHRLSALNTGCSVWWDLSKHKMSSGWRGGLTWPTGHWRGHYCGITWVTCRIFSVPAINAMCFLRDLRISDCRIRLNYSLWEFWFWRSQQFHIGVYRVRKTGYQLPRDFAHICTSECDFKWDTIQYGCVFLDLKGYWHVNTPHVSVSIWLVVIATGVTHR